MNYELNSISLWNGFCTVATQPVVKLLVMMMIPLDSYFTLDMEMMCAIPSFHLDGHMAKITQIEWIPFYFVLVEFFCYLIGKDIHLIIRQEMSYCTQNDAAKYLVQGFIPSLASAFSRYSRNE